MITNWKYCSVWNSWLSFPQETFSAFEDCMGFRGSRTKAEWTSGIFTLLRRKRTNGGLPQTPNLSQSQDIYGSPLQHSYLENFMDRGQPGRLQSVGSQRVGQNSHWAHTSTWYKQDVRSNVCPLSHDNIFRFLCFTCLWYIYLIIYPWELMGDVNWKRNKCK